MVEMPFVYSLIGLGKTALSLGLVRLEEPECSKQMGGLVGADTLPFVWGMEGFMY